VANRNVDGVRPRLQYQNVCLVGPDAVRESGMPVLLDACNRVGIYSCVDLEDRFGFFAARLKQWFGLIRSR